MHRRFTWGVVVLAAVFAALPAVASAQERPHVAAASPEAAGEYLAIVAGCHDCHTKGWTESKGKIPKEDQFAGIGSYGFRGAWGTNYGKNLRAQFQKDSVDKYLHVMTTADGGEGNLPMPWHNSTMMSDADLRAIYAYVKSLGPKANAERIPRSVKPGVEPTTPFVMLGIQQPAPKAP
jgi:cytochrome c553